MKHHVALARVALENQIFPGRNAGASLKQPGEQASLFQGGATFPGRNAGASLKQPHQVPVHCVVPAIFPGRNAGASLKLEARQRKPSIRRNLPRRQCRGLIEAARGR